MSFSKALLIAAALSAGLLSGTTAQAHASFVASIPAPNGIVAAPPKLLLVRFDEKLINKGSSIELFMTAKPGTKMAGPANMNVAAVIGADGKTLVGSLKKPLATGSYLVAWHAATADGARKSGTFSFMVR